MPTRKSSTSYRLYDTAYKIGDQTYVAQIEAKNKSEAQRIAALRNIGERIEGVWGSAKPRTRLLEAIAKKEWPTALHEACFLGFIGIRSGTLTVEEVVGDRGLVHEIAHMIDSPEQEIVERDGMKFVRGVSDDELLPLAFSKIVEERMHVECTARIHELAKKFVEVVPGFPRVLSGIKCPSPC